MADYLSLPGEWLGDRYCLLKCLGKQSGRETFLAQDAITRQRVIVKRLIFREDISWDNIKLFEQEVETFKTLSHPAIPQYLDAIEIKNSTRQGYALVRSYFNAKSLEFYLSAGCQFSEADIQQIVTLLLDILEYLHQLHPPLIHRNIKPSNILIAQNPDSTIQQIYLVDLGFTQTLTGHQGNTVTAGRTYGYMPPEQLGGRSVPASDLYSVGAVAIALATRKHPADLSQTKLKLQFAKAAKLSKPFTQWLQQMSEPGLRRRFSSVAAARVALERAKQMSPDLIVVRLPRLFWNAIWRSTSMGTIMGTLGGIFGGSIFGFFQSSSNPALGALVGTSVGLSVGFVNGLLVAIITQGRFVPLTDPKGHRQTVSVASTILGMIMSPVLLIHWWIGWGTWPWVWLRWLVLPSLIAGLGMGVTSQSIARWYERVSHELEGDE